MWYVYFSKMNPLENEIVRIKDSYYSLVENRSCKNCSFSIAGIKYNYCRRNGNFSCLIIKNNIGIPSTFKRIEYGSII